MALTPQQITQLLGGTPQGVAQVGADMGGYGAGASQENKNQFHNAVNYYAAGGGGYQTTWDRNYAAVAQNPKPYIDAGIAKDNGDGTYTLLKLQDPDTQQWVPAEVAAQQPWGKPSAGFAGSSSPTPGTWGTAPSGTSGMNSKMGVADPAGNGDPAAAGGPTGGKGQGPGGGIPPAGMRPPAGIGAGAPTSPVGLGMHGATNKPQVTGPGGSGMFSYGQQQGAPNPSRTRGLDIAQILQQLLSYKAPTGGGGGGVQTPPPTNPTNPANYTGYPMRAFDPSWLIRGMRSHFQGKSGAGVPYEVPTMNKGWQGNNLNNWFSIYGRG